jgi:cytochrome bd-type quinol oxidase subunit 1
MIKRIVIFLVIALLIGISVGSWAAIHQPHMMAALEALKTAKTELDMAEHNKGGHREKALELVNKAIEQTKKGIEAGEKER